MRSALEPVDARVVSCARPGGDFRLSGKPSGPTPPDESGDHRGLDIADQLERACGSNGVSGLTHLA
jgi:hypothetical protein